MTIWRMRQATQGDLRTVLDVLSMRVAWLREQGSDQWSTFPRWPAKLEDAISRGQTWLLETNEHEPVGTVTLSTIGDPDFWNPDERVIPALYVAKLATLPPGEAEKNTRIPSRKTRGLGNLMLLWTVDYAARAQLAVVRVDVWRTAHDLHNWYERHGWTKVRTVELPHRKSGALFERQAVRQSLPDIYEAPRLTGSTTLFECRTPANSTDDDELPRERP